LTASLRVLEVEEVEDEEGDEDAVSVNSSVYSILTFLGSANPLLV
jgi:hypothetical protein